MIAITVDQPFASLIVAGIKKWETRSYQLNGDACLDGVCEMRCPQIPWGERIAVHAATRVPPLTRVGDWQWESGTMWNDCAPHVHYDAPLGAILGTVEVWDMIPIVDNSDGHVRWVDDVILGGRVIEPNFTYGAIVDDNGSLTDSGEPGLFHVNGDLFNCGAEDDITDQLPYGEWQSGHWAWMLCSPEWFDQPVPMEGHGGVWWWEQ